MRKYKEKISDNSTWVSATPSAAARALPFCVYEAGHFIAEDGYITRRDTHDSFLMLYSVNGSGEITLGSSAFTLDAKCCAVIDCHLPHEYKSSSETWEFLWIHFGGSGAKAMTDAAYPTGAQCGIPMHSVPDFADGVQEIIQSAAHNDIGSYIRISAKLHSILSDLCLASLGANDTEGRADESDVREAVRFIGRNYFNPITVDDMLQNLHVSKYHFIRRFKRVMGTTPYSYLTDVRINKSKILLRTTDKSVAEIAEICGFADTSNFISHFKKRTDLKPLAYRRAFAPRPMP